MTKTRGKSRKHKKPAGPINYFMVSHDITGNNEFTNLPTSAQLLYFHLCRLRNRLTNGARYTPDRTFYRHDTQLAHDTGMSIRSIIRARYHLVTLNLIAYNPKTAQYTLTDLTHQHEHQKHRDQDALKIKPCEELPF